LLKVYTDGASRGNPGLSGAGIVILDESGNIICEEKQFLGVMTNNAAEYSALILSLEAIRKLKHNKNQNLSVRFYSDSLLMVNQVTGKFKVKDLQLSKFNKEFLTTAKEMKLDFSAFHIPRNENKLADKLANKAIDEREIQQALEF
jgi:ribonuclease HI